MTHELVKVSRIKAGKKVNPSYSIIDAQALLRKKVLMVEIKERKRHIVVDTQGNLLHVKIHEANTHDTVGGCRVFEEASEKLYCASLPIELFL